MEKFQDRTFLPTCAKNEDNLDESGPIGKRAKRHRCSNFSKLESIGLIKIWAKYLSNGNSKHTSGKGPDWDGICDQMQALGYFRTPLQCKFRVQNLVTRYYKFTNSKSTNGINPLYDIIGNVLNSRRKTTLESVSTPGNSDSFLCKTQLENKTCSVEESISSDGELRIEDKTTFTVNSIKAENSSPKIVGIAENLPLDLSLTSKAKDLRQQNDRNQMLREGIVLPGESLSHVSYDTTNPVMVNSSPRIDNSKSRSCTRPHSSSISTRFSANHVKQLKCLSSIRQQRLKVFKEQSTIQKTIINALVCILNSVIQR